MISASRSLVSLIAILFLFHQGKDSMAGSVRPDSDPRLNGTWKLVGMTFGYLVETSIPIEVGFEGTAAVLLNGKGRFSSRRQGGSFTGRSHCREHHRKRR